jgi:putative nucleotidyltransferase with HDIG domain
MRALVYAWTITALGVIMCVVAALNVTDWRTVALLCALIIGWDSLSSTQVRWVDRSLGLVFAVAALTLVGLAGTVLVCASGAFIHNKVRTPFIKRAFNVGQLALCGAMAGWVYTSLNGPVHRFTSDAFPRTVWVVVVSVMAESVVSGLLIAGVVILTEGLRATSVLRTMLSSTLSYIAYAALGLMLAVLWIDYSPVSGILLLLPLISARWALRQYGEQQKAYDATLRSLIAAIEVKDGYTRGHSERVSRIAVMIAKEAHLPEPRVEAVRYGGLLHDVGKTGIPSRILAKHGKLTEEEFAVIKTHPDRGVQMLDGIDFLSDSIAGVYHHHERMDGRGYPLGLAGDEVPEIARIIMVADAFDAMTSTRSYRPARSTDKAIAELRRCQGDQFDPRMVDALVAGVDKHGWEGDPEPFSATPVADDHAHEFAPAAVGVIPAQVDASHS